MASQITHIVLAEKLYGVHFGHFDKQAFLIGNVFPDIRKLAKFDRRITHKQVASIAEIQAASSAFQAGMLLHSYLDVCRELYVKQSGIYDMYTISVNPLTLVKLFEDEILYDRVTDWDVVQKACNEILPEEAEFPANSHQLEQWHSYLKSYFATTPTAQTRLQYINAIGIPGSWMVDAEAQITSLRQNDDAIAIVHGLYDRLETLI